MNSPNNSINADWQFRCVPLPAGYAEHLRAIMEHNLKRIVAREGLIIIVILTLLGIAFFVSSKITQHKRVIEDFKLYTIKTVNGRIFQIPGKDENILSSRVDEALANDKDGEGQDYINITYSSEIKAIEKRIKLSRMSQIANYGILFLIATYPAYL